MADDASALLSKAQQLDQAMQAAAFCKAPAAAQEGGAPPPQDGGGGGVVVGGTTPTAPVLGVPGSNPPSSSPAGTSSIPAKPSGGDEGLPPWVPLAAALGGGLLANLLGRALGRALSAEGAGAAPLATTAQPPLDTTGYGTQPGAATKPDGDLPPIPFTSDDLPPIPPDNSSQDQPAKDKVYHVTLVASSDSIRGDGMDTASLLPRVFSSDGANVTAESSFTFEKFTDIGDQAAVLSSGAATATLFSRLLLSGEPQSVTVCCHATVNTPTGPISVDSEPVTVCVRAANLQFTLDLPQDGGFGSGEGLIDVQTKLTVFDEPRTDFQVTFSCLPKPMIDAGPGQSTSLHVPKLVVADATYTVSASGAYSVATASIPLQDTKSITFKSLRPELCVTASKDEVVGDAQDSADLAIKGSYTANGTEFTPLMIGVNPPRLGTCPSPTAGATTTTFVSSRLAGKDDEDVTITVHARTSGDDGEVDLTGQTIIRIHPKPNHYNLEVRTEDQRTHLTADGIDTLRVYARVLCDNPEIDTGPLTQELNFSAEGPNADWLDMAQPVMTDDFKAVSLTASPPTDDAMLPDDSTVAVTIDSVIERDPISGSVQLTLNDEMWELEVFGDDSEMRA